MCKSKKQNKVTVRLALLVALALSLVFWFTFRTTDVWIGFIRHVHGGAVAGATAIFYLHYIAKVRIRWNPGQYLLLVLLIGVGVEVFEVWLSYRSHIQNPINVTHDTILDIYADLVGGGIIALIYYFRQRRC